jgi:hypothetical protein
VRTYATAAAIEVALMPQKSAVKDNDVKMTTQPMRIIEALVA